MAISGTYGFAPALADLTLDIFERIGIKPGEVTTEHYTSCRRSMNLIQSKWSNRGINLWRVDVTSTPMPQGQMSFVIDPGVIDVLPQSVFLRQGSSTNPVDILLYSMSRDEYAAIPMKDEQGRPTSYWFDRTVPGALNVWPVPDGSGPYELRYYAFWQMQDATATGLNTLDAPYRMLGAYVDEVAVDMAIKFAPERLEFLQSYALRSFKEASDEDREKVTLRAVPNFSSYFGRA